MTLDELQKKITPPSGWHLGLEEDFNADGIKENVAVVYDDANCGVELFRTPTHSTPPDDGEIDEDANNHIKYAVHCANHFQQVVEALKKVQSNDFEDGERFSECCKSTFTAERNIRGGEDVGTYYVCSKCKMCCDVGFDSAEDKLKRLVDEVLKSAQEVEGV